MFNSIEYMDNQHVDEDRLNEEWLEVAQQSFADSLQKKEWANCLIIALDVKHINYSEWSRMMDEYQSARGYRNGIWF